MKRFKGGKREQYVGDIELKHFEDKRKFAKYK